MGVSNWETKQNHAERSHLKNISHSKHITSETFPVNITNDLHCAKAMTVAPLSSYIVHLQLIGFGVSISLTFSFSVWLVWNSLSCVTGYLSEESILSPLFSILFYVFYTVVYKQTLSHPAHGINYIHIIFLDLSSLLRFSHVYQLFTHFT
jgi:hypothetical protein